jgi:hypothetical protein
LSQAGAGLGIVGARTGCASCAIAAPALTRQVAARRVTWVNGRGTCIVRVPELKVAERPLDPNAPSRELDLWESSLWSANSQWEATERSQSRASPSRLSTTTSRGSLRLPFRGLSFLCTLTTARRFGIGDFLLIGRRWKQEQCLRVPFPQNGFVRLPHRSSSGVIRYHLGI